MSKPVPEWLYKRILRSTVQFIKVTETMISNTIPVSEYEEYGQSDVSHSTFRIKAEIQPITEKDLVSLPSGMLEIGDAIGFFQKEYRLEGKIYTVQPEDLITAGGIQYEVQTITDYFQGDIIVFRRGYLKQKGRTFR